MSFIYFYLLILLHPYFAMWHKSFEFAGRKSWEALVPGYNYFVAFKVFCHKPFWSLLLIFPGVHLVMWSVINLSYIRRFGYYSFIDTLQGIFFPYVIFYKISSSRKDFLPETNWANAKESENRKWGDHLALFLALPVIGHAIALGLSAVTREKPGARSNVKEWGDNIWFALVAALIIRTYVFEPFQIPTGSMEKTLLVGDFLFVNKLAYGPKVPVTPLSYPLVHNTVPWVNVRSYTTLEKGTYTRLPGFTGIHRNDVVVFNYPSGDTAVYDPRMPNGLMGHDYHGIVNNEALRLWRNEKVNPLMQQAATIIYDSLIAVNPKTVNAERVAQMMAYEYLMNAHGGEYIKNLDMWKNKARKMLAEDKVAFDNSEGVLIQHYGVIYRPVDKRENYIKRCVGVPGDRLRIEKSVLYVNGKKAKVHEFQNLRYIAENFTMPSLMTMRENYGLEEERGDYYSEDGGITYKMNLTRSQLNTLKKRYPEAKFTIDLEPQYAKNHVPTSFEMINNLNMFPKDIHWNNTTTDFHEFQIPRKGQKIKINAENIAWYRRIITAYEGHKLQEKKDGIYIDGKKTKTYTFGMNYYWMMGDNRYNSADSRVWGFVPEDHIVGKASMVWFSKSPYLGIRWERLFKFIR